MALFNEDGGAGVAVASAPAAAPVATPAAPAPAATPAPSASPSAAPTPAPAGTPAAAPAAAAFDTSKPLLFQLPERGSMEYWDKYDQLPLEQQQQLEKEISAFERGELKAPEKKADPAAAPLPGDNTPPAAADELGIDEAEMAGLRAALPPEQQPILDRWIKTVGEMQSVIDNAAPLLAPEFQQGLDIFGKDPLIQARMAEIASGNPFKPAELENLTFDPGGYLQESGLDKIDPALNPQEFSQALKGVLEKAHLDGARAGYLKAEYSGQEKVAFTARKAKFESGLQGLMNKPGNEALRPTDPNLPFGHANHPMKPFVTWLASPELGDKFVEKVGMDAAWTAFLASNGQLNQAFKATEQRARTSFVTKLKASLEANRNNLGNAGNPPITHNPELPGVDTQRYLSDSIYATQVFDKADDQTRLKLERLRSTGRITT